MFRVPVYVFLGLVCARSPLTAQPGPEFHEGFSFGYVGNLRQMPYGLTVGVTLARIGFHLDVKTSHLIGEDPGPDSLAYYATPRDLLDYLERTDSMVLVTRSLTVSGSYELLPWLAAYAGVGGLWRNHFVQYRDPYGVVGPSPRRGSLHWIAEDEGGDLRLNLTTGLFFRTNSVPIRLQVGVESAVRGIAVGIAYTP